MKKWFRAIGALILILLLTLMAAVLAAQTSAQTAPKEDLSKGERDSARQKMAGSGPGRNPFSLPAGIHHRSKSPAVAAAPKAPEMAPKGETKVLDVPPPPLPAPLKVRAILIGSQTRLALIDRQIVREGDSIEGEKILAIAKDYVVLGQGDNKRTLFLQQSPLHLTVEEK